MFNVFVKIEFRLPCWRYMGFGYESIGILFKRLGELRQALIECLSPMCRVVLVAQGLNAGQGFTVLGGEGVAVDGAFVELLLQKEPLPLKLDGLAGVLIDFVGRLYLLFCCVLPEGRFLSLPLGLQEAESGIDHSVDGRHGPAVLF